MKKVGFITSRVVVVLGVLLVLGTAGASDLGDITMGRTIAQSAAGVVLVGLGALISKLSILFREE